ncbi:alpha-L-glutamate ligase [Streptomyces sp. CB03911]|uniref:ATP-grasp domain-containing protein n=1 Tax=Streptomyces sp. CB03911 TaxID=1804758 RepID=UPI00093B9233|nr:alpha-L-glutamate ligase [Streptomyces sp. CB03911]
MRICLLTPEPGHPLLAATTALLTPRHQVESLDPGTADPARPDMGPLADVYLLKARTPRALALARRLEALGAPVVNSAAATELCQDRTRMAELAQAAGLPFAATRTAGSIGELTGPGGLTAADFPLVVKSRHSRRHDLVAKAEDLARLEQLARDRPDEPVVVQPFTPNSGWDQKLWVIAGQVFAARRRSELAAADRGPALPLAPADLPADRLDLVRRVGEVFGLDVYGVDLLDGAGEPLIVDVNAFPGIRGQAGAPAALAALALRAAAGAATRSTAGPGVSAPSAPSVLPGQQRTGAPAQLDA